jgi:kynureninase
MTAVTIPETRDHAVELDAADPVARFRDEFVIPPGVVYLDGNSLGPPPRRVVERIDQLMKAEWGGDLIRSWTTRGWIDLAERIGTEIAPLIGSRPDEVIVADSVSINLFKLLAAALHIRPDRRTILTELENFPTDLYMAQGLADLLGDRATLRVVPRAELAMALDADVAVMMLTQVDFRSGLIHDMAAWTEAAHEAGALMLWDLSHSVGAIPVDLGGCGVDLAVGCGYKYLNGGPGAPSFASVARRHHESLRSPLWGWMGHAAPFEFDPDYRPAPGVASLRVGTPPILSLAALECGVQSVAEIGVERLRAKSVDLIEAFVARLEHDCAGHGFVLASPREPERRGSHVSFHHPDGYAVMQALIERGVIGDFREPDLLRFGFAPAYLRFVDVWDAVSILREIMESGAWDRPELHRRAKVT